jgi:GTP:adenosylcobinamide-phosphate guanylyltransferase
MVGEEPLILHQIKHLEANNCTDITIVVKKEHKDISNMIDSKYKGTLIIRKCAYIISDSRR